MRFDWHKSWTAELPDRPGPEQIVALIAADKFPEPDLIDDVIRGGLRQPQPICWVVRDRDKMAREALDRVEQPYILATLNPIWKWKNESILYERLEGRKRLVFATDAADRRAEMRESEIVNRCNRIILFTTPTAATLKFFEDERWAGKTRMISRGAVKKKTYSKGRSGE
jgi:hypothetical protein